MFENPKKVTSKDLKESSIDHLYTSLQNSLSTKKSHPKKVSLFQVAFTVWQITRLLNYQKLTE